MTGNLLRHGVYRLDHLWSRVEGDQLLLDFYGGSDAELHTALAGAVTVRAVMWRSFMSHRADDVIGDQFVRLDLKADDLRVRGRQVTFRIGAPTGHWPFVPYRSLFPGYLSVRLETL